MKNILRGMRSNILLNISFNYSSYWSREDCVFLYKEVCVRFFSFFLFFQIEKNMFLMCQFFDTYLIPFYNYMNFFIELLQSSL